MFGDHQSAAGLLESSNGSVIGINVTFYTLPGRSSGRFSMMLLHMSSIKTLLLSSTWQASHVTYPLSQYSSGPAGLHHHLGSVTGSSCPFLQRSIIQEQQQQCTEESNILNIQPAHQQSCFNYPHNSSRITDKYATIVSFCRRHFKQIPVDSASAAFYASRIGCLASVVVLVLWNSSVFVNIISYFYNSLSSNMQINRTSFCSP